MYECVSGGAVHTPICAFCVIHKTHFQKIFYEGTNMELIYNDDSAAEENDDQLSL